MTRVQPQRLNGTDGSWRTVTIDRLHEPTKDIGSELLGSELARGAGSSLADVSETSGYVMYQGEYGSSERIIQHPQHHGRLAPYCIRNDKLANRPILFARLRSQEGGTFPQNSSREVRQPSARAVTAVRRSSSFLRYDSPPLRQNNPPKLFEMTTLQSSYESLDSEPDPHWISEQTKVPANRTDRKEKFRWSRIRKNLGRSPPKPQLTIFDQPLYRPSFKEVSHSESQSHVPHDEFLNEIPRLPFPLISLPEAAMLQHFRRERGEEDHANPTSSFAGAGRRRQGTFSTITSSNSPRTPISVQLDFHQGSSQVDLSTPNLVRHNYVSHHGQRRTGKFSYPMPSLVSLLR